MASEGVENFRSIVTTLAALAGVGIAGFGLFTWKAQANWSSDTDLARKLLVLMFKHKDMIAQVRHPVIWINETEEAVAGLDLPKNESERTYLETAKVYERRWTLLAEIRSQIYPLLLEAEAIWGKDARETFQPIWMLETELRIAIQRYLRAINTKLSMPSRAAAENAIREKRDIMYDSLEDDDDAFKIEYNSAMRSVEDLLRPKLGQRR